MCLWKFERELDSIKFTGRLFHSLIDLGKKLYLYELVLTDGLVNDNVVVKAVMVTC